MYMYMYNCSHCITCYHYTCRASEVAAIHLSHISAATINGKVLHYYIIIIIEFYYYRNASCTCIYSMYIIYVLL